MVHLLNIPLESAGPLFVAAADFQEQINAGLLVTGTQVIKFMSVLVSIMLPYMHGFRSQPPAPLLSDDSGSDELASAISNGINLMSEPSRLQRNVQCSMVCGQCSSSGNQGSLSVSGTSNSSGLSVSSVPEFRLQRREIGDHVKRSVSSTIASLDEMPNYLNVGVRVAKAMSQYYSLIRNLNRGRGIDLNSECDDGDNESSHVEAAASTAIAGLPAPWEVGYEWSVELAEISSDNVTLECLRNYEGMVIVHRVPKYIKVSGVHLYEQVSGNLEMESDLFDALIRCVRQRDDECYASFGWMRWRVFFESDFLRILSGSVQPMDSAVCDKAVAGNPLYKMRHCKIIFIPARVQCSWVCFAWQLEENVVYVFDPSHLAEGNRVVALERACYLLKLAIENLCRNVFSGIMQRSRYAALRLLSLPDPRVSRLNRTGLLCYMFMCCFDGVDMTPRDSLDGADRLSMKIVREVVHLRNNVGSLPAALSFLKQWFGSFFVYCCVLHVVFSKSFIFYSCYWEAIL